LRWILRSLAIAVAGFVLVANPPAQAQQAMTAAQQATLSTAITAGDAKAIATLAASLSGQALAALATQLTATNNVTLITNTVNQLAASGTDASLIAINAVGVAIANSPNAISLAPAVVTAVAGDANTSKLAATVLAGAIISNSTNGAVVKVTRDAAAQAQVFLAISTTVGANGIVINPAPPVPPPCQTSCS
jgi:hypothetical protein